MADIEGPGPAKMHIVQECVCGGGGEGLIIQLSTSRRRGLI